MASAPLRALSRTPATLVTIRFSHYNERARWALDHHGVAYNESPWLPLLSSVGVILHGGLSSGRSDRISTRFSTPLLIDGRHRVHDSHAIMQHADAQYAAHADACLFPVGDATVPALCAHLHDKLGPHTRRVAYHYLLQEADEFLDTCEQNVGPGAQMWAFRAMFPFASGYLRKGLGITPDRVAKSLGYIRSEFDAAAARLEGHEGDFLLLRRFTAADISFASLAAPMLMVQPWEGYGGVLPPVEKLPSEFRDLVREMRAHPAGQYALRMFRQHRGTRRIPGQPRLPDPPHDVRAAEDETRGGGRMGPGVAATSR